MHSPSRATGVDAGVQRRTTPQHACQPPGPPAPSGAPAPRCVALLLLPGHARAWDGGVRRNGASVGHSLPVRWHTRCMRLAVQILSSAKTLAPTDGRAHTCPAGDMQTASQADRPASLCSYQLLQAKAVGSRAAGLPEARGLTTTPRGSSECGRSQGDREGAAAGQSRPGAEPQGGMPVQADHIHQQLFSAAVLRAGALHTFSVCGAGQDRGSVLRPGGVPWAIVLHTPLVARADCVC